MTTDPIGIYRHHKSCQLGTFQQENCDRPPLPEKQWGLRMCQHHKDLVEKIVRRAVREKTIGHAGLRKPGRSRRAA